MGVGDVKKLFYLAALTLVSGCSFSSPHLSDMKNPELAVERIEGSELPPPANSDLRAAKRPYLVGPFDKLSISVFGIDELNRTVTLDQSGRFAMPLVGTVEAAGKSTTDLSAEIENRLRGQYVRNPQVTVNLEQTVGQVVTIEGQVVQPGLYPVIGDMTLLRAVATARGTTEFARLQQVIVFRTVDGKKLAAVYDLRAIRLGYYPDPAIYANDLVVVGDSPVRRLFKDALLVAPVITNPLIFALR